ncbi:hypothetical protein AMAG_16109 [Allomyces macrogynus ATCC 38327]|uniref:TFIIE beta domain-containing protein n=1 Tax=Allomyces macrogynus (strain ATCC 38327) TaxID=578462 RepID=A0A0L0TB49_ALLM3|nr:hypothetical protein AMAG_16109 [Allomyces macrogynus ATCC 38327]|eukprot:KNE71804.1 hypothetical protein AMAG_16109 [Allomyces macrogynus ATCC 38327]
MSLCSATFIISTGSKSSAALGAFGSCTSELFNPGAASDRQPHAPSTSNITTSATMSGFLKTSDYMQRMRAQPTITRAVPVADTGVVLPTAGSTPSVITQRMSEREQTALIMVKDALKKHDGPMTYEQLNIASDYQLERHPSVHIALTEDEEFTYDTKTGSYMHRPKFTIRTKEDLLTLIKSSPGFWEVAKLKESNIKVVPLLQELAKDQLIFLVQKQQGSKEPVSVIQNPWPPSESETFTMADEFKKAFFAAKVPDDTELERELDKANIARSEAADIKRQVKKKEKKQKESKRKYKYQNAHHLLGTDAAGPLGAS